MKTEVLQAEETSGNAQCVSVIVVPAVGDRRQSGQLSLCERTMAFGSRRNDISSPNTACCIVKCLGPTLLSGGEGLECLPTIYDL